MKIRLASDLQEDSIVDGLGIRTVIWTQGCSHNCPSCHNPSTHDFSGGEEVELDDVIYRLENLVGQDGVTFSGGDPMFQPKQCAVLARKVHDLNMNVWAYTGLLIDGKFDISKKSMDIRFRGSTNQRVIDVKKSLNQNKIIEIPVDDYKPTSNMKKEKLYI